MEFQAQCLAASDGGVVGRWQRPAAAILMCMLLLSGCAAQIPSDPARFRIPAAQRAQAGP